MVRQDDKTKDKYDVKHTHTKDKMYRGETKDKYDVKHTHTKDKPIQKTRCTVVRQDDETKDKYDVKHTHTKDKMYRGETRQHTQTNIDQIQDTRRKTRERHQQDTRQDNRHTQ